MTQADSVHSTPPTNTSATHSRRGFLGSALTALAAGTALNATAIATSKPAPVVVVEDPKIIALGEQIGPLLDAYRNAVVCRSQARAIAEANCPTVPDELVCKGPFWAGEADRERDVEDKDVWPAEFLGPDGKTCVRPPRLIFDSVRAKASIARGNLQCDRRTSFGKRLVKMIEAAERHETGREAAIEQSGLGPAKARLYFAGAELEQLAYDAATREPVTGAGLLVQA
jgi:hypothetical protein